MSQSWSGMDVNWQSCGEMQSYNAVLIQQWCSEEWHPSLGHLHYTFNGDSESIYYNISLSTHSSTIFLKDLKKKKKEGGKAKGNLRLSLSASSIFSPGNQYLFIQKEKKWPSVDQQLNNISEPHNGLPPAGKMFIFKGSEAYRHWKVSKNC